MSAQAVDPASPVARSPFALTEDQLEIQRLARDFAVEQLAPGALEWDQHQHFPVDVLRKAGELGIGGVTAAEEFGGTGLGRFDGALIFEELATGCPCIAAYLSIHNMVVGMVDRFGDQAQRARWLPSLCSLETLGSYCLTEPEAGSDAGALRTRAVRDGDDYLLTGVKQFISGSGSAGLYVVMARTGEPGSGGISTFVVEDGAEGLTFGPDEAKMGWKAQPTRQVVLDEVRVPAGNRLGAEGDGFKIAMSGLDGGRLNIGACSLGGARSALDKSLEYGRQRTGHLSDHAQGQRVERLRAVERDPAECALFAEQDLGGRRCHGVDSSNPREMINRMISFVPSRI